MLAKEVTYRDFGGTVRTETFYFNITASELIEMEMTASESFATKLERIINAQDGKVIMDTFKEIMKKGYGIRSEDGRRFVKSDDIWEGFIQTEAYNVIFMELVTDSKAGAEFVNGLMPKGIPGQDPISTPSMTPAEQARQASEQAMQGFNRPRAEDNYGAPIVAKPVEVNHPYIAPQQALTPEQANEQARAEYNARLEQIRQQNSENQ